MEQDRTELPDAASPPPLTSPPGPTSRPSRRPRFGYVAAFAIALRFGREIAERIAADSFGMVGVVLVGVAIVAVMLLWRWGDRARTRRKGGVETTPDEVMTQIEDSGLGQPAFPEDGTLLGASLLVVNQRTKVLEVNTEYAVFGSAGQALGAVRQIGQSRGKQLARILTVFDQFFTHHFDVVDADDRVVLRLTRPRKVFRTKLHVFDGDDRYIGTIQQMNIFWKIRFELLAANGQCVGHLRARQLRAWDFDVYDWHERLVATVIKSWEGWARTAITRADRYAVRIHEPLTEPLRQLAVAAALATDLALKQDQRGV